MGNFNTVSDNATEILKKANFNGKSLSWAQLNRKAEELWDNKNKLEYVGAIRGEINKKMYCVFQELLRNSNNTFKAGELYKVENDVVFEYQKTKKPVKTGQAVTDADLSEQDEGTD